MEFFLALFLMLLTARVFGELLRRARQPSLVGELLAGMLLGTTVLNLIQPTSDLATINSVSLFFIMLLTGLNLDSRDIIAASGKAVLLSLPAFVLPLSLGTGAALYFGLTLRESLAVGLTLAITAVPVNSIILMDLGLLKTKLGTTVLTAGVIDDQMSLIFLGVVLQLPTAGGAFTVDYLSLAVSIGKVAIFVGAVFLADWFLRKNPNRIRPLLGKASRRLMGRESGFAVLLIFGAGVALVAEALGLHFIIGAYFAGILLNQAVGDMWLTRSMTIFSGATFGLFAPFLFAFIGIQLNFYAVGGILALFLALLLVAILGKMGGGYLGAWLGGFSREDSRIIGALLNSRGMVELVIATIVYQEGLINVGVFSAVVAIGIITTVMSGVLARAALGDKAPKEVPVPGSLPV